MRRIKEALGPLYIQVIKRQNGKQNTEKEDKEERKEQSEKEKKKQEEEKEKRVKKKKTKRERNSIAVRGCLGRANDDLDHYIFKNNRTKRNSEQKKRKEKYENWNSVSKSKNQKKLA